MIYDPLQDNKSKLELIEYMGGELAIVNDARASFAKTTSSLSQKDIDLITYLIRHRHFSPLRSTVFKFKVKAPLATCRQWFKHTIASSHLDEQQSWNETSFRYVDMTDKCEFYIPTDFRKQSKSNRQATDGVLQDDLNDKANLIYTNSVLHSEEAYKTLIELGVGRELARNVLAPAVYTSWVWTVSLQAVLHFIDLRSGHGAQDEITKYASCITQIVESICPNVIAAWFKLSLKES